MNNKFMRIIVFFDLPVKTNNERKIASQFRKWLTNDGYYMLQFSVYGRSCHSIENAKMHENRLRLVVPSKGSIRVMTVTEKQYASMLVLTGEKKEEEKQVISYQLSIF